MQNSEFSGTFCIRLFNKSLFYRVKRPNLKESKNTEKTARILGIWTFREKKRCFDEEKGVDIDTHRQKIKL